jgi:hypothetical protein
MKIFFYIVILVIPFFVNTFAQGNEMSRNVQSRISILADRLAQGEIEEVDILQISPQILTRTRITAQMLLEQFHYKFIIRDIRNSPYQKEMIESIKSISIAQSMSMSDIRWGVIFYGVDGHPIESFYFDKSGTKGEVEGVPVVFTGSFFLWLNKNFSKCFQ